MEWCEANGRDWREFWQSPEADLIHFIGKDNIVFHCLIFPILLHEHGGYNLPVNVPANAFMNLEGDKISTSRNWAVWVNDYLRDFPGRTDELRYTLAALMPEQKDSEFTWVEFRERVNNELADILGNFVNRVHVLAAKFTAGAIPPPPSSPTAADLALRDELASAPARIGALIERHRYREALAAALDVARAGNRYITDEEPWKVAKTDPERAAAILHGCAQVAANCAVLLAPFLPRTAEKLAVAFGVTGRHWADAGPDLAVPGTPLGDLPILFPKIDDATVETARASLGTPADAAPAAADLPALKPEVTYDTFAALDLRVARVLACEKVPKADKLLQLTLDTGIDTRTVLSGIAEHFAPEDVVGRDVLLLANLAPRTIRGIESRGMVLLAETPDGSLRFVTPEEQPVAGSTVR